jgi:folylpolyglutamate synthase/dihydropteroate synthase
MRNLAEYFGNPQNDMQIVHVAGTNGKGSVSIKVSKALELQYG